MSATSFQDSDVASFRAQLREWLADAVEKFRVTDRLHEVEQIKLRRAWERQLYEAGYNGLAWPTKYGGCGLGPIEEFVFAEECLAVDAPEPLGRIGRLLTAPGFMAYGTHEQQLRFLPAILRCDDIWCQGFSEPNAGSDLAGIRTSARRSGSRYLVNGQKVWTTSGHYADWCLLLSRTGEPGARHKGLTMFALPMHQAGVEVRPIVQISGESEFNEVFFSDAEVSEDCVIGGEGNGWKVAMTILGAERGAGFAALKIQKTRRALNLLKESVRNRPELQAGARDLEVRFAVLRWQTIRAIERMASDRNPGPSASVLKLGWSELQQNVVRFGFETDDCERRDAWRFLELATRYETIASGTSEIQRNIMAERVLGLPR